MERRIAIQKLKQLEGQDLHALAHELGVTVLAPNGKVNKGWAGHVCERYLGLPLNSAQSPNFGSWELKSIPLKRRNDGTLTFKETMAVTMIDPYNVARTPFEESHLLSKLRKAVIVARIVGGSYSEPTMVLSVTGIDLNDELYSIVEQDYNTVRDCINDEARGFSSLTGKMGVYIQPRTKGSGHGSVSRAFYARTSFLARIIDLSE
ncbi:MAG: MvaI/BcnI family restriction endonuclease [Lachnospiraceae bacterium]|jgi:DNA mismatch repair protein MutH|nr:MvaI/BcnI family restriction endonuclease [Lachnospiraceae bacterium]